MESETNDIDDPAGRRQMLPAKQQSCIIHHLAPLEAATNLAADRLLTFF
jgi:hypothetical protein